MSTTLFQDSETDLFKYTSGPRTAQIAIVGESWGSDEARLLKPFVGASGKLLDELLASVGVERSSVFCTNVVEQQPPGNNMYEFFITTAEARKQALPGIRGLYPRPNVLRGLTRLYNQLELVRPKVVIGFGNYALWALTQKNFKVSDHKRRKVPTGIMSWRGSQLYTDALTTRIPLLPTVHPAAAMRQWSLTYTIRHDLQARLKLVDQGLWDPPSYSFIVRPSYEQVVIYLEDLLYRLDHDPIRIAADLETRRSHLACCGLAESSTRAICIPFMCTENQEGYWDSGQELHIIRLLHRVFLHPNSQIIGQNFLYDAQYIALYWGIKVIPFMDTMLAQHACWPGTPKGLDYLSSMYCKYHRYWKDEGKEWTESMPEEQLWEYNCLDCVSTWEVSFELEKLIQSQNVETPYQGLMRQFPMALRMMMRGVRIDLKVRAETSMDLVERIDQYEHRFEKIIPPDVWERSSKRKPWYRSPQQQGQIFYDLFGLKEIRHPKTHARTMNDAAIEKLKDREPLWYPILEMLQEYRSMGVFQNNFCNAALSLDKRMRCSFNIGGTETYRWSSSEDAFGAGTNLQNLPKGNEED